MRHKRITIDNSTISSLSKNSTIKLIKPAKLLRRLANNKKDETKLKHIPECRISPVPSIPLFSTTTPQDSILSTSSSHSIILPTSSSSVIRRKMTSYSALKRKVQRQTDLYTSSRFQVNLEHVLGFTSISNSLVSQNRTTLAYAAGSSVVLYNIASQKQDFIINNARKAITSLSLSSDGKFLVTGECGHEPKVRVWDVNDKSQCVELGDHKFAIDCVVRRIAFAEDGSYFVTVGNRHVKFWYLAAPSLEVIPLKGRLAILAERKDNIFTDVVCGRGDCANMTYTITHNGLVSQFNEHRQICAEKDLKEKANCLAIGDTLLIVGCSNGSIFLFSTQNLDYIMSLPRPHYLGVDIGFIQSLDQLIYPQNTQYFPDAIALCLDEDNSIVTCFYSDHSFYIWDITYEESVKKLDSHLYHSACGWSIEPYSTQFQMFSLSPLLQHLSFITCSSDNSIRFWSLNSSTTTLLSKSTNIFSKELMKIIYLDDDHSKLCDSQTSQERSESSIKTGGRCLKISPDGLSIAIGDRNGNIRIFDLILLKQKFIIEAHDSEVLSIDYSQPEMGFYFLASSSRDRFVHIFDPIKDYQLIATLDDHSAAITAVRFSSIISSLTMTMQLISCSADKSLIFRTITKNENGKYQFIRSNNIVEKQTFYDMVVDRKRNEVSTACQDRMIRVYNTLDGKRVRTCKGSVGDSDTGYLIKIDLHTSGRYVATSCSNKCVYIWDIISNECIASLCGHSEIVTDIKFSQDGNYLYTISGDSCIFVWNTSELAIVPTSLQTPPLPSQLKNNDVETSIIEEKVKYIQNTKQMPEIVNDEHQPLLKRQRSLWETAEPHISIFDSQLFTKNKQQSLSNIITEENSTVKMTDSTSSQGSLSQDEIGDESFVDESKQGI
ncbi:unnamed protein product [Didymodactylos carnosus]|uniref:MABP1/WDR62 second WD40 domain-containing protein n=1 Tax=Didymodactylos carnosus TaxID=1234261 RepID=A0A813U4M5_9BILA|nr:unnamed protein product [Didymodactylos carnosus]CAF0818669.1 unnamed protein product [Didymodactylos carnosus]CAF3581852.1 unnamed protein product [Didymodactylos carnosus]CAF3604870.1 unnamed protein product [Didymodactylos carnosus]